MKTEFSAPCELPKGTCKHWWKKGACRLGETCRFLHPPRQCLPVVPRKKYRQQVNNAGRFRQFREWLINTFKLEALKDGGIISVAGGKGILSFEFLNVHSIPSTVIDPRPLQLERSFKLWKLGMYHKEPSSHHTMKRYMPAKPSTEVPEKPKHLRAFFVPELWESILSFSESSSSRTIFENNLDSAENAKWTKKGLRSFNISSNEETSEISGSSGNEDTTIRDVSLAKEILEKSNLVVGLHPDQAAASIVQFAIQQNKSFAVVPCCVYNKEFPKRKLKNGNRVTSYDDLLNYLEELDHNRSIKRCTIPNLDGKNICLFRVTDCKN
mmetsp:Transcript_6319/g.7968  ORF Transcript_6319/g.7968 Transcript_6319/m.7968 type:complete len:325 (-) Transcript_6319:957-1931(-)